MSERQLSGGSVVTKAIAMIALVVLLVLGVGISGSLTLAGFARAIPAFVVIGAVIVWFL
ncbi:hypothetical protein [Halonotius terrestris]|uniref:hypothetical protein n=1 Tax=Halonotius terrestris TaxID=2487750 RepID=UPI00163CFD16|nr:hypothetical protein [Halonotius terrestris]